MIDVDVRERPDELADLVPEWAELHESSGTRVPFSTPAWVLTWQQHFLQPEVDTPRVYEVRDGGRLIGVAPFYAHRMRGGLERVQQAGTGSEWFGPFEVPGMLSAYDRGRDVARAVVQRLCQDPRWDWVNVSLGDGAHWLEPEWLPDASFTSVVRRTTAAVVLDLQVARPEDVLVGHRNLKESLRRARNRLNGEFGREGGWCVRVASSPGDVAPALARLVALHRVRSMLEGAREPHRNLFETARGTRFLTDVVHQEAACGRAQVYELVADGTVLASQLMLKTATATYSSVSGVSADAWRFSGVTYLQWQAVVDAHAAGHVELNLSTGPNQAKLRWSNQLRYHPEFSVVGPRRRSRAAFAAAQAAISLKSYREAARSHRPTRP